MRINYRIETMRSLSSALLITLTLIAGCVLLAAFTDCHQEPAIKASGECGLDKLASIEAAYVAEVLENCDDAGMCQARPDIRAKYKKLREDWITCKETP